MNIRPFAVDVLLQGGIGSIGVYARYSPMTMFEKGKGPDVHPVSSDYSSICNLETKRGVKSAMTVGYNGAD